MKAYATKTLLALALSALTLSSAMAEDLPQPRSFSGAYLAGRFAQRHENWDAAQAYTAAALSAHPNDRQLEQRAFLLSLGAGDFAAAKELALKVAARKDPFELSLVFLACDALAQDKYKDALDYLKRLPDGGFGQYTKPALSAWALAGSGKKAEALKLFAKTADAGAAYKLHAGMIEEYSGNMNGAADNYKAVLSGQIDFNAAILLANFYERYGRPEITNALYRGLDKAYPFNPYVRALAARDPKRAMESNIKRPAEGAARALFDVATLLYGRRAYDSAQIYGNLVRLLDPASSFPKMMIGDISGATSQYKKAVDIYASIKPEDPFYSLARLRIAEMHENDGRTDDAITLLKDVIQDDTARMQAQVALGDVYRKHERYAEAVSSYDAAMAGVEKVDESLWAVLYARGMAYAQMKQWHLAEKDLLQALEFQPRNPMILNFIAYNWADQGVNLDRALEFAKNAAALKPDDGYILDSYGWTLFRMARYGEAVDYLELAVQQVPGDSTLLDHLGDAYWQAGQTTEARSQWKRASDISRDDSFKKTISEKLKYGIAVPERKQAGL